MNKRLLDVSEVVAKWSSIDRVQLRNDISEVLKEHGVAVVVGTVSDTTAEKVDAYLESLVMHYIKELLTDA